METGPISANERSLANEKRKKEKAENGALRRNHCYAENDDANGCHKMTTVQLWLSIVRNLHIMNALESLVHAERKTTKGVREQPWWALKNRGPALFPKARINKNRGHARIEKAETARSRKNALFHDSNLSSVEESANESGKKRKQNVRHAVRQPRRMCETKRRSAKHELFVATRRLSRKHEVRVSHDS
nr:PREDICTED: uncharacterized protein LOC105662172 [Megachile rotundata]